MADAALNKQTSLSCDDVIPKALLFFSTEKWRAMTQSARSATFAGRPPIPWLMIALTVLGFMFCIIPGIIMYFLVVRKIIRLQNLIVIAAPTAHGTDVTITYPDHARALVENFLRSLPPTTPN